MAWAEAHRDHNKLIQFAATETTFVTALRRGQDIAVADVVKHVKEAIAQGRIRDTDPDVLAHAMVGVVGPPHAHLHLRAGRARRQRRRRRRRLLPRGPQPAALRGTARIRSGRRLLALTRAW